MSPKLLNALVKSKVTIATDTILITLDAVDGSPLPAYDAGSHIDLHLPNGLVRQYSLTRSYRPNSGYEIAVLLDSKSRGGSQYIHRELVAGDKLQISTPKNFFPLGNRNSFKILLAGGIGITPILCMAETLSAKGERFSLHYSCRSEDRAAFLDRIQASPIGKNSWLYFDNVPERNFNAEKLFQTLKMDVDFYVCGPAGFIDHCKKEIMNMGWSSGQFHSESFGYSSPAHTFSTAEKPFFVVARKSGFRTKVEQGETVVEALKKAGVSIPVSCEVGQCGTCMTNLLDGIPDHRDSFLSKNERDSNTVFIPCVSRSTSEELVLDC